MCFVLFFLVLLQLLVFILFIFICSDPVPVLIRQIHLCEHEILKLSGIV